MRIYMDVCCLNRPFDDQTQDKIRIESEAVLAILQRCVTGEWQLLSSEVLEIEIDNTPDHWKKSKVYELYKLTKEKVVLTEEIVQRAIEIQKSGIKPFDSLHLASAEYSKADIFLTTDNALLHLARRMDLNVRAANPLNWFMEVNENE